MFAVQVFQLASPAKGIAVEMRVNRSESVPACCWEMVGVGESVWENTKMTSFPWERSDKEDRSMSHRPSVGGERMKPLEEDQDLGMDLLGLRLD